MGQSTSSPSKLFRRRSTGRSAVASNSHRSKIIPPDPIYPLSTDDEGDDASSSSSSSSSCVTLDEPHPSDLTFNLPDECLACIFQSLASGDRINCSLVCRRWLRIEGQSRHRISLNAQEDLVHHITPIFDRFDSVTKLALKCDRRSVSIGDEVLILISVKCRNLTRLKLRACRSITDDGMEGFSKNCRSLKKLSCGSCTFGAGGMNALVANCTQLEELSVKRLRGITDRNSTEPIVPGPNGSSLRVICLKELYNGQCFEPLIVGSKFLKTLKLFRCAGDWDELLQSVSNSTNEIKEIHLEKLQVSDVGLSAISKCPNIDILHLVKTPECTNLGLISVAEGCKLLRKLHIDGWKANRIGDEGLIAVAKNCPNLQELVLIGINPTQLSLEIIASNCEKLERLALCGSDTVGDQELSCIAAKCNSLKKLCIKNCPVSNHAMEALACGCPNLVKVKVKKCKDVTSEGADWLRASRGSLSVNLDMGENEQPEICASDGGQENGGEILPENAQIPGPNHASSSRTGRSRSFKIRDIKAVWEMNLLLPASVFKIA
ncbi:hypothetical protein V2J09_011799 [Rumex salicifolius]